MFEFNHDDDVTNNYSYSNNNDFTRRSILNLSNEKNNTNLFEDFIGDDSDGEYNESSNNNINCDSNYDNKIHNEVTDCNKNSERRVSDTDIFDNIGVNNKVFGFESNSANLDNMTSYSNEHIFCSEDVSRFNNLVISEGNFNDNNINNYNNINNSDDANNHKNSEDKYIGIYDLNKDKNSKDNELNSDVKMNSNEYMYGNIYDIGANSNSNNINSESSCNNSESSCNNGDLNTNINNDDNAIDNNRKEMIENNNNNHHNDSNYSNINDFHDNGNNDIHFTNSSRNQNIDHIYDNNNDFNGNSINFSASRHKASNNADKINNTCEKNNFNVHLGNNKIDWKHVWNIIEYTENHIICSSERKYKFKSILFDLSKIGCK
ncbi:hypothetical protein FG379_002210 [Cryptosporidium bovis]|uniref:uncharacterized protein n=1 Tax=Cryptosporidium bovis TaxID=310047 RepID=UPI00351A72F3|nr:hypothetical protein FG379_002210 [Cryptosporidium bovis]